MWHYFRNKIWLGVFKKKMYATGISLWKIQKKTTLKKNFSCEWAFVEWTVSAQKNFLPDWKYVLRKPSKNAIFKLILMAYS